MHDVLVNDDVGNPGVEVKVLDDARSTEIDEFGSQLEFQNAVSENKEFCCFQTSEFGIGNEARQGDGASMSKPLAQPHSVEEDQEQSTKVYGSATATTTSQLQTPNAMQDVMNQLTVMQEQMTSVEQKLSVMQEQMTKMEQAQKLNYDAFNQLQNSVNSKLEAIPEQIKDALKEECNAMFEKVFESSRSY
uniref:enhancer of mRNA-decapping protein 4-like n=1 Tax=Fragaria vesca subsp. vesca TaxID=101020 RepID=UPI0005CB12E7|nr:PREDICTED: enhancer of mRNA-decapping protein 4-like [Fragaria vesca subsp. vesca]